MIGTANGNMLIDDGESRDSYTDNQYAYYAISVYGSTISIYLNSGNDTYTLPQGMIYDQVEEFKILDASDIKDVDFACYTRVQDGKRVNMTVSYNQYMYTLSIRPEVGDAVRIQDIIEIKYGNSSKDYNPCIQVNSK